MIEGICENRSKAKGRANVVTWPVELEVYLRGGRIIEVNRLVFPM